MKKKLGPFANQRNKNSTTAVPITLSPAVPRGYVDNALYPGLLLRSAVDQDLLIDVPAWLPIPDPPPDDTKDDHLDDTGDFQSGYLGTTTHDTAGPYVARIAFSKLTQGTHFYSYKVVNTYGANVAGSTPVMFIVDRLAPYDTSGLSPRALMMPTGHSGPLDAAYFAANSGVAELPIPDYDAYDAQPGDRWLLLDGPNGAVVASGDVFPDETVKLTLAQATLWEGAQTLYYRLQDVSGNVSKTSLGLPVTIAILPAPVLLSPGVRFALTLAGSGDRLIDLEDAAAVSGMDVIIPDYIEDRVQDNLYVRLTTLHSTNLQVGPIALGANPLPFNFPVAYPTLKTLYGNSFGPIALTVSYGIERGGVFHWLPTASQATIELDLSKAGPVNPDEPDLVNPNLPLPILTGAGSGLTNQLDPSDAPLNAPVVVPLWTTAPLPAVRPFTVVLYYGNEEVDRVAVDNTSLPPSGMVDMQVAWPFISKHGNSTVSGDIPLRYEIITPGTDNRNLSPTQDIVVSVNVISFLQPSVDGSITTPAGLVVLGCNSAPPPTHDVVISVPPHSLFTQGMVITVIWEAFSDDAGTVAIAGASGSFPHTPLNPTEVVTGFKLRISPSTTYLKPINAASTAAGSVRIRYSVPIVGPSPVESAELHARVRAVLSGSTARFCDGSPWP